MATDGNVDALFDGVVQRNDTTLASDFSLRLVKKTARQIINGAYYCGAKCDIVRGIFASDPSQPNQPIENTKSAN